MISLTSILLSYLITFTSEIHTSPFLLELSIQANTTHCMDCISKITTSSPTPCAKRCGVFQISWTDWNRPNLPSEVKKSWKPCSRDRVCSQKLIEAKTNKCTPDRCLGHARDIFLSGNIDCDSSQTSTEFKEFMSCYKPEEITATTMEKTTITVPPETEPSTPLPSKSRYSTNEKEYVLFIGLTGSFIALVAMSVIVYVYRSKLCRKKENHAPRHFPMSISAINKAYFERGHMENYANDDDGSSGFEDGQENPSTEGFEMEPVPSTPPPHVFFRHHLTNIEPLEEAAGVGHFGSICRAIYTSETGQVQKVAIKSLIKYNFNKVMEEAQIACLMDHPHVLKLLGIFIENETLKLVFPFMERADLGHYLRTEKDPVTPSLLRSFCIEVASGMEYLASKKVVHRDLAARNCMLDADLHVKVADFGLSRKLSGSDSHHRMVATSVIPQSSAPECFLPGGKINEKTDVWAFGVTCWEIFNEASVPPIMVQNDGTLIGVAPAKKCPNKIYELMIRCWSYDQDHRPSFSDIFQYLTMLHNTDFAFTPKAYPKIVSLGIPRTCTKDTTNEERTEKFHRDIRGYV